MKTIVTRELIEYLNKLYPSPNQIRPYVFGMIMVDLRDGKAQYENKDAYDALLQYMPELKDDDKKLLKSFLDKQDFPKLPIKVTKKDLLEIYEEVNFVRKGITYINLIQMIKSDKAKFKDSNAVNYFLEQDIGFIIEGCPVTFGDRIFFLLDKDVANSPESVKKAYEDVKNRTVEVVFLDDNQKKI